MLAQLHAATEAQALGRVAEWQSQYMTEPPCAHQVTSVSQHMVHTDSRVLQSTRQPCCDIAHSR